MAKDAHDQTLTLTAYAVNPEDLEVPIIPAYSRRKWMDANDGHAYRCLPLNMANQMGWFLLNPIGFTVTWEPDPENSLNRGLTIIFDEELTPKQKTILGSIFGSGILTWRIPYLFRTSPGYNLMISGPSNWPRDGIAPLQGMVETDWLEAPFTMNWKITRPNFPIHFEKDAPFCMITPIKRGVVEQHVPSVRSINEAPALQDAHRIWSDRRRQQITDNFWKTRLAVAFKRPYVHRYDLSYLEGKKVDGSKTSTDHQTRLKLRAFDEKWNGKIAEALKAMENDE